MALTVDDLATYAAEHLTAEQRPLSWQLVTHPRRADTGKARRRDWR